MYSLFTTYRLPMNVYENYNHLYTWKVKTELWTQKHLFTVQTITYANLHKSTVQQQQQSIRTNLHIRHFATILYILDQQYLLHNKCNEKINIPYFPAHKTHRDFFVRNFRKRWMYFNFSNLLEENRIVTYQN